VTDKNGYIVNASGDYLQGYPVDDSGTLQTGTVTDIQIKTGNIPAQATDSMTFTANFDASDETIDRSSVQFDPTTAIPIPTATPPPCMTLWVTSTRSASILPKPRITPGKCSTL
jgi:flagellar hook protein FlgE